MKEILEAITRPVLSTLTLGLIEPIKDDNKRSIYSFNYVPSNEPLMYKEWYNYTIHKPSLDAAIKSSAEALDNYPLNFDEIDDIQVLRKHCHTLYTNWKNTHNNICNSFRKG